MREKEPIETMLDGVTWTALPAQEERDGIPVATHEGTLKIGDVSLRVVQLSNGQRVIDSDDMAAFFRATDG